MSTTTGGVDRRTLLKLAGAGTLGAATFATVGPGQWSTAQAANRVVPRKEWGFNGWVNGGPSRMDRSKLTHFVVHYHGPKGGGTTGVAAPRKVHEIGKGGKDNGAGFRYNFLITQKGEIYEGRGFTYLQGATQGANDVSISVQLHISGSMKPSKQALAALEWLYRRSHKVLGDDLDAALKITGHEDHTATSCPGKPLGAWVDGAGQKLYRDVAKDFGGGGSDPGPPAYPGKDAFRLGKSHPAVKTLDKALIRSGYDKHHDGDGYQAGTVFSKYTLRNVRAFQKAQGWSGSGADGYPGPETWKRLVG
jgi:N-acetylmuramoyl-L-alanine amidase/Putative peptidoglycan binding domain